MNKKAEIKKAYQAHQKEISLLIEKLQAKLDRHANEAVTWGHVGDLGYLKGRLNEIDQFLNC